MARLRRRALNSDHRGESGSTADYLSASGFSSGLRESFFGPFFAGVTLDPDLAVPASWFLSLFGYFAAGNALLPAGGMEGLPLQLAADLPDASVRLESSVASITPEEVVLDSGETIGYRELVLAADASTTARLLGTGGGPAWLGTTTLYYRADRSPVGEPILVLNGEGHEDGPVNHLAVLSDAQPTYAPEGSALISVSVLGVPPVGDEELDEAVRAQLARWYGDVVGTWRRLRVDRIERALPRASRPVEPRDSKGALVCGDHVASPSIQGALESGRLAAERAHASLPTSIHRTPRSRA